MVISVFTPVHNLPLAQTFALEFHFYSIWWSQGSKHSPLNHSLLPYAPILRSPSLLKEEDCETWFIFSHVAAGDAGLYRVFDRG